MSGNKYPQKFLFPHFVLCLTGQFYTYLVSSSCVYLATTIVLFCLYFPFTYIFVLCSLGMLSSITGEVCTGMYTVKTAKFALCSQLQFINLDHILGHLCTLHLEGLSCSLIRAWNVHFSTFLTAL